MREDINIDIRDNFDLFTELIKAKKIIKSKIITLKTKKSNIQWLEGFSDVIHKEIDTQITLLVDLRKREDKYGINLRCRSLTEKPFFRFDSGGPGHRNVDENIPLIDQMVHTPHFNTYDEKGREFAYKTPQLRDEKDSLAIIDDVNFGLSHFCIEANMSLKNDELPEVVKESLELDFDINISPFNEIKFE